MRGEAGRRKAWDKLAKSYDELWVQKYSLAPSRRWVREVLLRHGVGQGAFLDMGCGTGQLLMELAQGYPDGIFCGVDASPAMLEEAYSKMPEAFFAGKREGRSTEQKVFAKKWEEEAPAGGSAEEDPGQKIKQWSMQSPEPPLFTEEQSGRSPEAASWIEKQKGQSLEAAPQMGKQKGQSPGMPLFAGKQSAPNSKMALFQGDICREIPEELEEASFDVITCCHSFPYYRDQDLAFRRLLALLKREGILIFVQGSINGFYDKVLFTAVEATADKARYLSCRDFKSLAGRHGEILEIALIRERWYMPSIYGFVVKKGQP